jgi:hypothetical protein
VWDESYRDDNSNMHQVDVGAEAGFTSMSSKGSAPSEDHTTEGYAGLGSSTLPYTGTTAASTGAVSANPHYSSQTSHLQSSPSHAVTDVAAQALNASNTSQSDSLSPSNGTLTINPPARSSYTTAIAAQHKVLREANERLHTTNMDSSTSTSSDSSSEPSSTSTNDGYLVERRSTQSAALDMPLAAGRVIQHRDLMHELPPPYSDLSLL